MILAVPLGLLVYTMYQEGVFETTKQSIQILVAGVNQFRKIEKEDLDEVQEMQKRNAEISEKLNEQRRIEKQKKQEKRKAKRKNM